MSVVSVQVGQCGNNVGFRLHQVLHEQARQGGDVDEAFFRGNVARAVLVDTEPKVLGDIMRGASGERFAYDSKRACCSGEGGAGNNWAYGYKGYGTAASSKILEACRLEAEASDYLSCVLLLHSAAGGTGSGLGAYLSEALKDDFCSKTPLVNVVVLPYNSGEVIVQSYNALLTMAHLAGSSDGIVVVENEDLSKTCQKTMNLPRPSLWDLNGVIAKQLAGVILPTTCLGQTQRLGDQIQHLCPNRDFLFLKASMLPQIPHRSVAFTDEKWSAVVRRLLQMHLTGTVVDTEINWRINLADCRRGAHQSRTNMAVANTLMLRGSMSDQPCDSGFADTQVYASWSPQPFRQCYSQISFCGYSQAACLLSNCQAAVRPLETTLSRAFSMYAHGAYLHQYTMHGVERADFERAFLRVEQVVQSYDSLASSL